MKQERILKVIDRDTGKVYIPFSQRIDEAERLKKSWRAVVFDHNCDICVSNKGFMMGAEDE